MDYKRMNRELLKSQHWDEWGDYKSDQKKKIPAPAPQKPVPENAIIVDLPEAQAIGLGDIPLREAFSMRQSHRKFKDKPLSVEELAFLLWATQGVRRVVIEGERITRTVPSAGCRHPFETYLAVHNVEGLQPGLYRYLSLDHKLHFIRPDDTLSERLGPICRKQVFAGRCAVTFLWSFIPYRTEWRYAPLFLRIVPMDVGHLCQNLYLACTAINSGTCAIGAYYQEEIDSLVGLDGEEEFVIYLAPVGKV